VARRTQHGRALLLKFGYAYNKDGVPGWIKVVQGKEADKGEVNVQLHYPEAHDTAANYLTPVLEHAAGADHRINVVGAELKRQADATWKVAPGTRRTLAFDYRTGSGIQTLADGK